MHRSAFLAVLIATKAACLLAQTSGAWIHVTRFPLASAGGMAVGPDGDLWYTDMDYNRIGRVTTDGSKTEYEIPIPDTRPNLIAPGPDDALWFTAQNGNHIGRITTDGEITEYPVPGGGFTAGITAGPDGAMWFCVESTATNVSAIGRITTAGVVTLFPTPVPYSQPWGIATGSDGALWFTEPVTGEIGRITTEGLFTEFQPPTGYNIPMAITGGPDGALWFTESDKIGRVSTVGVFTEYSVGSTGDIVTGPDGALWFTGMRQIGRITTRGALTLFHVPNSDDPAAVVAGPAHAIWFNDWGTAKLGRVPACGLGLSLTPVEGGLAIHFDLGITTPVIWKTWITDNAGRRLLWSKPIDSVVPSRPLTFTLAVAGSGTVESLLEKPAGQVVCAEMQSATAGQ